MKTIKHAIQLPIEQTALFDLTQDYSRRLDWDPYLSEAYLINAEQAAIGVESYCKNKSGSVMISKYISFSHPHVAAVTMTKGHYLLKRFSGAWNVKKVDGSNSILIFTYQFELKGGIFGKLLLPLVRYIFSRDMRKRLTALKAFLDQSNKAAFLQSSRLNTRKQE